MQNCPNGKNLVWSLDNKLKWLEEVESWPWEEIGDEEWRESGCCPRCGHYFASEPITKDVVVGYIKLNRYMEIKAGLEESLREYLEAPPDRVYIFCECAGEHEKRHSSRISGCGFFGIFSGPAQARKGRR